MSLARSGATVRGRSKRANCLLRFTVGLYQRRHALTKDAKALLDELVS